jgi:hypothetical protein
MSGSSYPPGPPNFLAMLSGQWNKRYIHITFHFPPSLTSLEAQHRIQPVINTADDWLKYADNCWIVWSSLTPKDWYGKFALVPELKDCSILIFYVDLSPDKRFGQLPQWVWDWIQKIRA